MAISDEDHLQLINLGLKSESPINTLYTILENKEGKGFLEFIKCKFEGIPALKGEYLLDEAEDYLNGEDILSISGPIRPKSLEVTLSQKPDIKICLENILPSWIEQGYHFQFSELKEVKMGGSYSNILCVDDSGVVIYEPKLISNIDEIKNYCKEKAINLKVG